MPSFASLASFAVNQLLQTPPFWMPAEMTERPDQFPLPGGSRSFASLRMTTPSLRSG